ncbi:hypothetical protein ACFLRX_08265 [Acidobacteriota bacterium]
MKQEVKDDVNIHYKWSILEYSMISDNYISRREIIVDVSQVASVFRLGIHK